MTTANDLPTQTAEDEEIELDAQFAQAFADEGAAPQNPVPQDSVDAAGQEAQDGAEQPVTLESLQRRLEQMAQNERMQNGRTSALARENNALKAQLAELAAAQQKAASRPAEPEAPADDDDTEDALREAPDLSRAVERRIVKSTHALRQQLEESRAQLAQMAQTLQATQQAVMPLHEAQRQQTITTTHAAMDELFSPAWREEVSSDRYAAWLERQPGPIRELAQTCITPGETAQVLRLYFSEHGNPVPRNTPQQAARAAAQTPATTRLRQASGIPSRSAPVPAGAGLSDSDLDAAFAAAFRG